MLPDAPTAVSYTHLDVYKRQTKPFTDELTQHNIPYIYIDSNIKEEPALSFDGQNSHQSGYFAARMLMLLAGEDAQEIVIFRKINEGIVGSNQQDVYKRQTRNLSLITQSCVLVDAMVVSAMKERLSPTNEPPTTMATM